ncbi:MAG: hypothetical protein IKM59_00455 [Oscillospiraceae bacterium]|nr:hypothetical protein [Oscillospiraceae bacterium]
MKRFKPYLKINLLFAFAFTLTFLCSCSLFTDHDKIISDIILDKAMSYLEQNCSQEEFVIDRVYYAFKSNCYRVEVSAPTGIDSHFHLDYDLDTYELRLDGYETDLLSGRNTYTRLVQGYDTTVADALGGINGLLYLRGDLCRYSDTESHDRFFSPRGLVMKELILNHVYNMENIGREYGYIEITVQDEDLSVDRCLDRLLQIHEELTRKNGDYYVIALTMQNTVTEGEPETLQIYGITQEVLFSEDPLTQLQQMWVEQEMHRQKVKAQWD